jgi:circadian clock protein KaiC
MSEPTTAVRPASSSATANPGIRKAHTGIEGFDEVTGGGLPHGRTTLITGAAGSGKTLFGIEFLVHGALDYDEPGVLMAFEESGADLAANVASLGFDLDQMQADGKLSIESFRLDPRMIVETGEYDLDGLFIRLGAAVDALGAKRVVLDSIEILFSALHDTGAVRSELARLFAWLKDRDLTAVATGERGDGLITRHGIEEYVSDCVITLDHRVHEQISTRRLRVVKYRGSLHGTNEFPFLITDRGIVVLPVMSAHLEHTASRERVLTGVPRLDTMLGGGIYRGSSVLLGGEAGTGKTTLAAKMLESACAHGERALFVSEEESPAQLVRNMASVGIDLQRWVDAGLLRLWAVRPTAYGLEMHLASLLRMVNDFDPSIVALDAMASLNTNGVITDVTSLIIREIDLLKSRGLTAVLTSLLDAGDERDASRVSSLMDTWLLIRNVQTNGEQNRLLSVRKSRGTAHSNQVREFVLSGSGLELLDVSVGANGAIVGSARLAVEAEERVAELQRAEVIDRRHRGMARRRTEAVAQVEALHAILDAEEAEAERLDSDDARRLRVIEHEEAAMGFHRGADAAADAGDVPAGPATLNGATAHDH